MEINDDDHGTTKCVPLLQRDKIHSNYSGLVFEHTVSLEKRYWRLDWFEDVLRSDFLVINEQEKPNPHPHEWNDEHTTYKSSSFSILPNVVKHLTGYAYYGKEDEYVRALLFELEELFILIEPGSVIEIKLSTQKPDV